MSNSIYDIVFNRVFVYRYKFSNFYKKKKSTWIGIVSFEVFTCQLLWANENTLQFTPSEREREKYIYIVLLVRHHRDFYCCFVLFHWCQFSWIVRTWYFRWHLNSWFRYLQVNSLVIYAFRCALNFMV